MKKRNHKKISLILLSILTTFQLQAQATQANSSENFWLKPMYAAGSILFTAAGFLSYKWYQNSRPEAQKKQKKQAFLQAVSKGDLAAVNEALNNPQNIIEYNVSDERGKTPIWMAARKGHTAVVNLLISKGCNVNQPAQHDHLETENGSSWYIRNGETPLHCAVKSGSIEIVKSLTTAKAALESKTVISGSTALHDASANGKINVVQTLVASKAPIGTRDSNNESAVQLAAANGHYSTAGYLVDQDHTKTAFNDLQARSKVNKSWGYYDDYGGYYPMYTDQAAHVFNWYCAGRYLQQRNQTALRISADHSQNDSKSNEE